MWWKKEGDVMQSYMNINEVYSILDIINRKIKQMQDTASYIYFESPLLNDSQSLNSDGWQVESVEVVRDTTNPIHPNILKQVIVAYRNGAVDTISLIRGLNPPVDSSVPDAEYINNLMITAIVIETTYETKYQKLIATITRENGYGAFKRVDFEFEGEELQLDYDGGVAEGGSYENPNDFYSGEQLIDDDDENDEGYGGLEDEEGEVTVG